MNLGMVICVFFDIFDTTANVNVPVFVVYIFDIFDIFDREDQMLVFSCFLFLHNICPFPGHMFASESNISVDWFDLVSCAVLT